MGYNELNYLKSLKLRVGNIWYSIIWKKNLLGKKYQRSLGEMGLRDIYLFISIETNYIFDLCVINSINCAWIDNIWSKECIPKESQSFVLKTHLQCLLVLKR